MATHGYVFENGILAQRFDEVIHRISIRKDPVGRVDIGLWVELVDIPREVKQDAFLHGQISFSLMHQDGADQLDRDDFEYQAVIESGISVIDWAHKVNTHGIEPFFSRFLTAYQTEATVKSGFVGGALMVQRAYLELIGDPRAETRQSGEWHVGDCAAYEHLEDLNFP